ncbi:MAG: SDR family oxidoreductase, partial [Alphaproteobacteria bacterium]
SPEPEQDEPDAIAGIGEPKALKAALIAEAKAQGRAVTPAAIEAATRAILNAREIRATLAAVRAAGSEVEYRACDVRDGAAVERLVAEVTASHGRIDGLIHGAGILEDKLILDKTPESFDRVLRTKTDSAFALAKALDPDALKFAIFFASVAGRFGNRGQGDYGAANEIVSKLARQLNALWPARVKAISWGPWDGGGMVTEEIRAQFAQLGIEPIPPELGVQALEREIIFGPDDEPEVVWGRGPWEQDMRRHSEEHAPGLREAAE